MVTTMSESCYKSLHDRPALHNLDSMGLDVTVADSSGLQYIGYIECSVTVRVLDDLEFIVLVLVVPDTEFTCVCSVIVCSNVIS